MDQQDKKQSKTVKPFTPQEVERSHYMLTRQDSLMRQFKTQGGYRINMDGSISTYAEVMADR